MEMELIVIRIKGKEIMISFDILLLGNNYYGPYQPSVTTT